MSAQPRLADRVLRGDRRALARLITRIENRDPAALPELSALYPHTGRAHIVGVTGPSGSGKSTLVNEVAKQMRRDGETVGIIAVDPTSPFSGGALLGDRIRMRDLTGDDGIFIRSMASRGSLGGLAQATGEVVQLLDAAGFDTVLVETVGAGQSEVDIAKASHTTLVVQAPDMGDDIQAIKAGLLEIADIFVVNKADRPGAERAVRALQMMQRLGGNGGDPFRYPGTGKKRRAPGPTDNACGWEAPILQTVSITGEGIAEVVAAIQLHRTYLLESGEFQTREASRVETEFERMLREALLNDLLTRIPDGQFDAILAQVVAREVDPYSAVERLIAAGAH